jgi:hypothetical protein
MRKDESCVEYPCAINLGAFEYYDIIVVDGKQRVQCCSAALSRLRKGGIIILDNSDWYPQLCSSLRDRQFIQIDFHGHGPINAYTWTTSIFFEQSVCKSSELLVNQRGTNYYHSKSGLRQAAADDAQLYNIEY